MLPSGFVGTEEERYPWSPISDALTPLVFGFAGSDNYYQKIEMKSHPRLTTGEIVIAVLKRVTSVLSLRELTKIPLAGIGADAFWS